MADAYIVETVRTAGGRRGGALRDWHPANLGAEVLNALVARSGIDGAVIDDVIVGCVTQAGEQSFAFGRNCVLASNLPQSVPAVTIDRQCGSSQQAVQFAAQAVMSGTQDVVVAMGVESMTRVPMMSNVVLQKHGFNREELDRYALESHRRATAASNAGAFDTEIVPLAVEGGMHTRDEGIRDDATLETISSVKLLDPNGMISAANASQICDGAAGVLVVSEAALKKYNLTPKARIVNLTVTAGDPVIMLEEPLPATDRALDRAGMKIDDIDLFEVNEAFAPIPMAWLKHTGADPEKLNVNGGAIALGHPLGASGARLMTTLVHSLHAQGKKYGLQTMCEGGGIANVTIIEAV
jgi:acetyl-CoA C-acetyltransferase